MKMNKEFYDSETKSKLSTLWIFIVLNVVFRDFHDLFFPGLIEQMISGVVNGRTINEEVLLMGSIAVEIPIIMILLSRTLRSNANRLTNIVVGILSIPLLLGTGLRDLDDFFFLGIEVIAVCVVVWTAWKWSPAKKVDIDIK